MRKGIWIVLLSVIAFVSLFIGVQDIELSHVLQFNFTKNEQLILQSTRIPRTVSLIIAGATLSICGLIMQHLTQNKFVSPTKLEQWIVHESEF